MVGLGQQHTRDKSCLLRIPSRLGICASIIIAECIYKSDWGQKDLSRKENNLASLKADEYYKGKICSYDNELYKSYDNWLDFVVDLGDYYVFSGKFEDVLKCHTVDQQLDALSIIQDYPTEYCSKLEEIIRYLRIMGIW